MSALPAEPGAGGYAVPGVAPLDAPTPGVRARRPGLRVVPATRRNRAPLAPFVVVVAGLLVLGLAALLGLNTVLAQDAFRIHDLEQANARLSEREQALSRELTSIESPASVAERARELGMVPSASPLFLRLPDGAVLGSAPEGEAGSADPDALAAMQAAEQDASAEQDVSAGEGTGSAEGAEAAGSADRAEGAGSADPVEEETE